MRGQGKMGGEFCRDTSSTHSLEVPPCPAVHALLLGISPIMSWIVVSGVPVV